MSKSLVKLLLITYLLNNCFHLICGKSSKSDEKEIEQKTDVLVKKSCCQKDFEILVLKNLDECFAMTSWQFGKDPISVCRTEVFEKSHPCNEERRGKCNDLKDKWLDCIERITEQEKKGLKPKYQNNEELIKELPREKMLCFQDALEKVTCS